MSELLFRPTPTQETGTPELFDRWAERQAPLYMRFSKTHQQTQGRWTMHRLCHRIQLGRICNEGGEGLSFILLAP